MTAKIPQKPTLGQLFNFVVDHLGTQKTPAIDYDNGNCLLKTDNGLSCAVGCLIDDRFYSGDNEGGIYEAADAVAQSIGFKTLSDDAMNLLIDLQDAHDSSKSAPVLRTKLKRIAKKFGFGTSQIERKIRVWINKE